MLALADSESLHFFRRSVVDQISEAPEFSYFAVMSRFVAASSNAARCYMKLIHPIWVYRHRFAAGFPISFALMTVVALSLGPCATNLSAQEEPSRLLSGDLSGRNTVSANQLLTPYKALHSVERARKDLIAGRIDQAQKEVSHALDISPRCALALNIQGIIYLQNRNLEGAAKNFHQAIAEDPALGTAYLGLAISLISGDRFEEALPPLDRAISLLPGAWLPYFELAITHLGIGDADAALEQISHADRFAEGDAERKSATVYIRGLAYIRLRDYDSAKKYLANAVAFDPDGCFARLARVRLEKLKPLLANSK